jgi:hypothetical protein
MSQLESLLKQCTVKITVSGHAGWGTGFFVAPELVLTCAHVVREAQGQLIQVWSQNWASCAQAVVEQVRPDLYDLALLRVPMHEGTLPPCVYLDEEIRSRDPLYLFGYPDQDFPNGCPVTFDCEGLTGDEPPLIKFALGQVRPGMSGAPLLNQRTGKVCGLVKFTRDRTIDLGGGAIPASVIFECFPYIKNRNEQFQKIDFRWQKSLDKFLEEQERYFEREEHEVQELRSRKKILTEMSLFWIDGVLEKSLHKEKVSEGYSLIQLSLERKSNAIDSPWGVIASENNISLSSEESIESIFESAGEGRSLLLLGEPGSGKTIGLLALAKKYILMAERDSNSLIPIILNLSSWLPKASKDKKIELSQIRSVSDLISPLAGSLAEWIIDEVNIKYGIKKSVTEAWVERQEVLLLLDGLDEVKPEYQSNCVTAINAFQRYSGVEMVVCCRREVNENFSNKLMFREAIYLKPLNMRQVHRYLGNLALDISGLRTLIKTDIPLQELATSPLMLHIMVVAFEGVPVEEIPRINSLEERKKQLFDEYIRRMFERSRIFAYAHGIKFDMGHQYTKAKVINGLIWLSKAMRSNSQSEFLIEKIQPSLLKNRLEKCLYIASSSLLTGFLISFSTGLIVFNLFLSIAAYYADFLNDLIVLPGKVNFLLLVWYMSKGVAFSALFGVFGALLFVVFCGTLTTNFESINLSETISWSWKQASVKLRSRISSTSRGFVRYAIPVILISILTSVFSGSFLGSLYMWGGLLLSVGMLVIILLPSIFVSGGISSSEIFTAKPLPNQGIWNSVKTFMHLIKIFGLLGCVISLGLIIVSSIIFIMGDDSLLNLLIRSSVLMARGLFIGIGLGMFFGIYHGGLTCIQHVSLRIALCLNTSVPWDYARFLNYATERLFLRRVGGSYIFIHRLLLEHFSRMRNVNKKADLRIRL